jgi:predicted ATPase
VAFLEQGLALLGELAETRETLSEALNIRISLGSALVAVKGSGSSEVEAFYTRAHELVERLGDSSRLFPVLWGLWYASYGRGRYAEARERGERLLEAAQRGDDTGQLVEAHHALWPALSSMGQATASVFHAERGLALYNRERHAAQAFLYGGHDPGVCCRYHLALGRWLLGYPDRSLDVLRDAAHLAEELRHPLTTMITLWFSTWVYYQRGRKQTRQAAPIGCSRAPRSMASPGGPILRSCCLA